MHKLMREDNFKIRIVKKYSMIVRGETMNKKIYKLKGSKFFYS
jgi:hypothetical protein